MDRFVYNNEFDKDVIYDKMSKIERELEEEREKPDNERDEQRERELIYAQMIQGLKLNTFSNGRRFCY